MFTILLLAHIVASIISLLLLARFTYGIILGEHTKTQALQLKVSSIFSAVFGVSLLFFGGSITRVCVVLGMYGVAVLIALHFGSKKGYASDCPYLNGQ